MHVAARGTIPTSSILWCWDPCWRWCQALQHHCTPAVAASMSLPWYILKSKPASKNHYTNIYDATLSCAVDDACHCNYFIFILEMINQQVPVDFAMHVGLSVVDLHNIAFTRSLDARSRKTQQPQGLDLKHIAVDFLVQRCNIIHLAGGKRGPRERGRGWCLQGYTGRISMRTSLIRPSSRFRKTRLNCGSKRNIS